MTEITTDVAQLRQDLDDLLARVSMNWSACKTRAQRERTRIGDGACVLGSMERVLGMSAHLDQPQDKALRVRKDAMIVALGFPNPYAVEGVYWSAKAVADWNDVQTSNESVLCRIKDAIERLGA